MAADVRSLGIRRETLPRLGTGSGDVVWIIGFVVGIGIRRCLMLPLSHANQREILPVGPEVRPKRAIDENHVALCQSYRPVTMTPSCSVVPCCCARCMKAVVVARGSAYPLSGS